MSKHTEELIGLAKTLGAHRDVSHWAISMQITGKGDLIDRLKKGGDVRTATYEELIVRFSDNWPTDLEWPRAIPRPSKSQAVA